MEKDQLEKIEELLKNVLAAQVMLLRRTERIEKTVALLVNDDKRFTEQIRQNGIDKALKDFTIEYGVNEKIVIVDEYRKYIPLTLTAIEDIAELIKER